MTMWYREGELGPVHRVQAFTHAAVAPISTAGEVVTGPIRGVFAWARDLGVSRTQLSKLKDQNESLRKRVAELEEARLENVRLRELVKLAQASELESVAARVIGRPTNSWEGVIVIDRGSNDGIASGMAVVGPGGLLGQTIEVTGSTSRIRLVTDQRSGVAAMVQGSRATGIARGTLQGGLELQYLSKAKAVKTGDVIVTSGLGGVYPKGIVIGEVTSVDHSGELYPRVEVQPSADIAGLEEVLVVTEGSSAPLSEGGE